MSSMWVLRDGFPEVGSESLFVVQVGFSQTLLRFSGALTEEQGAKQTTTKGGGK